MTEDASAGERSGIQPEALDPFAYFPGAASKIRSLGGDEDRPELAYGFHTHYVRCAPGYCTIAVKFDRLQATHGLIHLRVHMLSTRPGAQARVANVERLYLSDLAAQGGEAIVRFESLPGTVYAMFGQILDTTDATASGLTVTLDRPGGLEDEGPVDYEPTRFGQDSTRGAGLLTAADEPTLAAPVSQVMSPAQLLEPAFLRWQDQLASEGDREADWEQAFILQALDRYGLLDHNADGVGHARLESAVPAILARRGCNVTLVSDIGEQGAGAPPQRALLLRIPTIDAATVDALLPVLHVAPAGGGMDQGTPCDFAWSLGMLDGQPGFPAAMRFVEAVMAGLRPGGVCVHVMRIALDGPARDGVLTRSLIERLALNMVSQGHSAAQIRFRLGEKPRDAKAGGDETVPFGLILRRG